MCHHASRNQKDTHDRALSLSYTRIDTINEVGVGKIATYNIGNKRVTRVAIVLYDDHALSISGYNMDNEGLDIWRQHPSLLLGSGDHDESKMEAMCGAYLQ